MPKDATPEIRMRDNTSMERAKRTIDDLSASIYALQKQGTKLANSLGFETVHAAQAFIDIANDPTPYKQLAERLERLQLDHRNTSAEIQELKMERDALRANLSASGRSSILFTGSATHDSASTSAGAVHKQLKELQRRYADLERRYDEMRVVKERSDAKYKADYSKFKALVAFFRSEEVQAIEAQLKQDYPTLSNTERKRRRAEVAIMKEAKVAALMTDEQNGGLGILNFSLRDKENQQTHIIETPAGKRQSSIPIGSPSSTPQSSQRLQSAVNAAAAPSSLKPMVVSPLLANPRSPLQSHPLNHTKTAGWQVVASNDALILVPSSSQTEEDSSQDPSPSIAPEIIPISGPARSPAQNLRLHSANTEEDSQDVPLTQQEKRKPLATVASTPKLRLVDPLAKFLGPSSLFQIADKRSGSKPRHSDTIIISSSSAPAEDINERPRKIRRVSSPGLIVSHIPMGEPGTSAATPLYVGSSETPGKIYKNVNGSTGRKTDSTSKSEGKGKERQVTVKPKSSTSTPTNARASSSKQLADYSSYKGRGRYANVGTSGNTAINASFAIDPTRNGGKDFQYDEVVRGRTDRRIMDAGDCECCRDYYAAIGPMPNRLQPPLWRTPPSSPGGGRPCLRNDAGSARTESAEIASHKQAISRHRHQWARGNTPPSYWSIGFPTTQEAQDINDKAQLMHQEKKRDIQEEAEKGGGRYKKR